MPVNHRFNHVLHFDDINRSHEATGFSGRTDLPQFHVFTLEETYPSTRMVMPPYTFNFYSVALFEEVHNARLEVNTEPLERFNDTISFQGPGHVRAWVRGEAQQGFIVHFQADFLNHLPQPLLQDFPFFGLTDINMLPLAPAEQATLRDHFVRLQRAFRSQHPYRVPILQSLLLALLWECKGVYDGERSRQARRGGTAALATRFLQLIEQHYLAHHRVQAYADLLHVTPNHLSQAVRSTLGRHASDVIADRVLLEAKKLLRYTDLPIADVAHYVGFEEPTHFTRFFKRKLGLTPLAYRRALDHHDGHS